MRSTGLLRAIVMAFVFVAMLATFLPKPVGVAAGYDYGGESLTWTAELRAAVVEHPGSDWRTSGGYTADDRARLRPVSEFVAPSSRLVPGGGLAARELAGGHTLARHVGQSADDLSARLAAQPNIPAASTFSSRATAEASIASSLDTNQAAIQAWLRGGGGNAGSAFTTSFADPVGTTLIRGASGPTSATSVRVVLRPDASMPGGFRILKAFPE